MKMIKPDQMIKKVIHMEKSVKEAKNKIVNVGLPIEKTGSAVYKTAKKKAKNKIKKTNSAANKTAKKENVKVVQVGAWHEYGTRKTPKRSFLREPFLEKEKEIGSFINKQFKKIYDGQSVDKGLELIGAYCTNISKASFRNNGYGQWKPLKQSTIKAKGSSKPLIETGTLRNSITWVVK